MQTETIQAESTKSNVMQADTLIVGSGAAGLFGRAASAARTEGAGYYQG